MYYFNIYIYTCKKERDQTREKGINKREREEEEEDEAREKKPRTRMRTILYNSIYSKYTVSII